MKHQSDIGLGEPEQLYVYSVLLYISLYLIGNNIYIYTPGLFTHP